MMTLRENVVEFLNKEYPDGYCILVIRPDQTLSTQFYNPKGIFLIHDAATRMKACGEFWEWFQRTNLQDNNGPDGENKNK